MSEASSLTLLCLNGWGGKLHAQLLPYLAALQPDVLCLQEVTRTPGARAGWLTYRDDGADLIQRADLFAEVAAVLPEHDATFCPAAIGDLWEGDQRFASHWGLASFVQRSLPVTAQHHGFVHGAFSPDGYGTHPRPRTAHALRILHPATGMPITIAHMHGLRDPGGKADTPARRAQALRFRALVQSVAQPGDALVLCGDFNVEPGSETFGILSALGVEDLVLARGFFGTRTSHYPKPQRFADYMLVSPQLQNARFDVIRAPEVSDHCPLLLHLGCPPRNPRHAQSAGIPPRKRAQSRQTNRQENPMSYAAIIPPLDRSLAALATLLTKAEAHCAANKIEPAALINFRLFPDMFPFSRQVQLACDFAARSAARLSGAEVPSFADTETTFPELLARVATARAFMASCPADAFKDADSREITLKMRSGDMTFDGLAFRTSFATPQFYFHFTTVYNILRHNGVALGKMDYMGA